MNTAHTDGRPSARGLVGGLRRGGSTSGTVAACGGITLAPVTAFSAAPVFFSAGLPVVFVQRTSISLNETLVTFAPCAVQAAGSASVLPRGDLYRGQRSPVGQRARAVRCGRARTAAQFLLRRRRLRRKRYVLGQ